MRMNKDIPTNSTKASVIATGIIMATALGILTVATSVSTPSNYQGKTAIRYYHATDVDGYMLRDTYGPRNTFVKLPGQAELSVIRH